MRNLFKRRYEIHTDGSFKNGIGSWAYVITFKSWNKERLFQEKAASQKKTSSNRMEFQAAIEALKALPPNSRAHLYSDSQILVHTMNTQIVEWRSLNWLKQNGRAIPNVDLVKVLDELNRQHQVTWKWIKAHSGIPHNERCDELCIRARSY